MYTNEYSRIKLALKIRPSTNIELNNSDDFIKYIDSKTAVCGDRDFYSFDHVFSKYVKQETVFEETVQPMIESLFDGFNATIIVYGQSGSGKTFTMGLSDGGNGLIQFSINKIFQLIQQFNYKVSVNVTFIEIYQEKLKDLLDENPLKQIRLYEVNNKFQILNCKRQTLKCSQDANIIMCNGLKYRTVGSTSLNNKSSRSHAIFTISIEQHDESGNITNNTLNFVDLAGSEKPSGLDSSDKIYKESIKINSGLLELGKLIRVLSQEEQPKHISNRNSNLTKVLKDGIGGSSRTLIIACVRPSKSHENETLRTLEFATCAKKIKNNVICNNYSLPNAQSNFLYDSENQKLKNEIKALKIEIDILKADLKSLQQKNNEQSIKRKRVDKDTEVVAKRLEIVKRKKLNDSFQIIKINKEEWNIIQNECTIDKYNSNSVMLNRTETARILEKKLSLIEHKNIMINIQVARYYINNRKRTTSFFKASGRCKCCSMTYTFTAPNDFVEESLHVEVRKKASQRKMDDNISPFFESYAEQTQAIIENVTELIDEINVSKIKNENENEDETKYIEADSQGKILTSKFSQTIDVLPHYDLEIIANNKWLTGKILEKFAQMTFNKKTLVLETHISTAIFDSKASIPIKMEYFNKVDFSLHDSILGYINSNKFHWTMVFINLRNNHFCYLDPFGENERSSSRFLEKWKNFLVQFKILANRNWKIRLIKHPIQTKNDTTNCGIYVIKFSEHFATNSTIKNEINFSSSSSEIKLYRKNLINFFISSKV